MQKDSKIHYPSDIKIINRITLQAWPKDFFNKLEGVENIKKYYNDAYGIAEQELNEILNQFHPLSWIIEAYQQLNIWSLVKEDFTPEPYKSAPKSLCPIGRYGWRYIIEKSIENLFDKIILQKGIDISIPDNINRSVFTLLLIMGQTSELSNFIHVLENRFINEPKLTFAPNVLLSIPELSENDKLLFDSILNSLQKKPDLTNYNSFLPTNDKVLEKINRFLQKNFNLTYKNIEEFGFYIVSIAKEYKTSTIILPLEEFIELAISQTSLDFIQINNILCLSFFNIDTQGEYSRDFLRKNQQDRMLNYAGIIIDLTNKYNKSKSKIEIDNSPLVIINPLLIPEWMNNIIIRLALGKRNDLKSINEHLSLQISDIERFYKRDIFEKEVMGLLKDKGFICFNLDKLGKDKIPCGEIDIIACRELSSEIYIIECKALAPITDARGIGQVISDHYKQKKYHNKFIRKINWLSLNEEKIKSYIKKNFKISLSNDSCKIISYYISCFYNPISDYQKNEYKTITFYEFDQELRERYKK